MLPSWEWSLREWNQLVLYQGGSREGTGYEPGSGPSPGSEHAGTLNLDFPASRMVGNKSLMFISYPGCGILLRQPKQTQTSISVQMSASSWS